MLLKKKNEKKQPLKPHGIYLTTNQVRRCLTSETGIF